MIYRTYKTMRMLKTDEGGIKLADLSSNYPASLRPGGRQHPRGHRGHAHAGAGTGDNRNIGV